MKRYVATRRDYSERQRGTVMVVLIEEMLDGTSCRPLPNRRADRSPDGFEWGYGGSAPAALAESILWDFLGEQPHPAAILAFKNAFVTHAPPAGFELIEPEIATWRHEYEVAGRGFVALSRERAW